jgi:hypothetical protein
MPKTIHLVHAYYTQLFIPEYLHYSLWSLHLLMSCGLNVFGALAGANRCLLVARGDNNPTRGLLAVIEF